MNIIIDKNKRVIDTIEYGETRTGFTLSCGAPDGTRRVMNAASRVTHEYVVFVNYSFSMDEKEGEVSGFAIARKEKEDERFECDGVGDNIVGVLFDVFKADYPANSEDQRTDLISEILEMVQDEAKNANWRFFMSDYEKAIHYES